jgi:hypothetical protein
VQRLDEDEGEAVWEEGIGAEEEEAAVLEAAEQVRASQQLTDGAAGARNRSRIKAARTQAAPSAGASTSTARNSSSEESECNEESERNEESECNEDSNSNSDSDGSQRIREQQRKREHKIGGGSKGVVEQRGLIGDSKLTCKQACNIMVYCL